MALQDVLSNLLFNISNILALLKLKILKSVKTFTVSCVCADNKDIKFCFSPKYLWLLPPNILENMQLKMINIAMKRKEE